MASKPSSTAQSETDYNAYYDKIEWDQGRKK